MEPKLYFVEPMLCMYACICGTKCGTKINYTLLAKKLCDTSYLGKNLDLIHSHFKTDIVMSFIS